MNLYSTLYFHISDIEFESFFLGFILNDFVSNLMLHQKIVKELQGIYEDQMQISSLIVSDCPSLDKISKVEIDFCCNCHESQKR